MTDREARHTSSEAARERLEGRGPRRVPWLGILVEAAAIVISILLAFGIDRWWDERDRVEREAVLLQGLLEDLRQDSLDYLQFAEHNGRRVLAANLLMGMADAQHTEPAGDAEGPEVRITPAEAFALLGIPTRLETVLVSYDEMTATGGSSVVVDPALRRRVATYYALAQDRADINASMDPGIQRFHAHLESLGYAPSDGDRIPAAEVLRDPVIRAQVRNMGSIAGTAEGYGWELLELATGLIRDLEAHLVGRGALPLPEDR